MFQGYLRFVLFMYGKIADTEMTGVKLRRLCISLETGSLVRRAGPREALESNRREREQVEGVETWAGAFLVVPEGRERKGRVSRFSIG